MFVRKGDNEDMKYEHILIYILEIVERSIY